MFVISIIPIFFILYSSVALVATPTIKALVTSEILMMVVTVYSYFKKVFQSH